MKIIALRIELLYFSSFCNNRWDSWHVNGITLLQKSRSSYRRYN